MEAVSTWEKCSNAFLAKFFLLGKTNSLRNKISGFQQVTDETVTEAWERLQDYISACPPSWHGGVVHHPKLLSWVDSLSPGAYKCYCWRFFLRSQY
jgi:hypothetical protein